MTLDEVIAEAKRRRHNNAASVPVIPEDPIDAWIIETLGEAQPCGQISPEVYPGEVIITREMVGVYEPREAIAIAVDIIRSAEQAKGRV